jgi:hypothetical protein
MTEIAKSPGTQIVECRTSVRLAERSEKADIAQTQAMKARIAELEACSSSLMRRHGGVRVHTRPQCLA